MPEPPTTLAKGTPETSIASSLIPYPRDDEKAGYLGYMCCGFSVREALHMVNRSKSALSEWRHDQVFVDLENRIPEFRKQLSREYVEIEFFRNFRLALSKDHQILKRSLGMSKNPDGTVEVMSKADNEYLLKLRSQYSPQQLQILEAFVSGDDSSFNWAKLFEANPDIVQLERTDRITMAKR